ncbi:MAG: phytanoyl-CoA dioxygenase family protein [Xanthomonadales bacterium]|nr:phytanoyl-CoA dioxygenase family protein [Xanthomonadales bacterium]
MKTLETDYREQGYTVVAGAIPPAQLQRIRDAALRIVHEFDVDRQRSVFSTGDRDRGRDAYFMDSAEAVHCFLEEHALDERGGLTCPKEQAVNKIGHALHDLVPEFSAFCRQDAIAESLRAIGYPEALLWQTMYIFKQPRIGGEVRWHQDAAYLISEPASVVGFWVAIEDATRDNGCLWVQPGGHRGPLREIYEVDPRTRRGELRTLDETPWPGAGEGQPVEVEAGSLVIFNDRMPHYSSHNHSSRSRHAFTMHFADPRSRWLESNWLQRPKLDPFFV